MESMSKMKPWHWALIAFIVFIISELSVGIIVNKMPQAQAPEMESVDPEPEVIIEDQEYNIVVENEDGSIISNTFGGGVDKTLMEISGLTIFISVCEDEEEEEDIEDWEPVSDKDAKDEEDTEGEDEEDEEE